MPEEEDTLDLFESSLPSLFEQPIIAHSSSCSETYVHNDPLLPFPIKLRFPNPPARLNSLQAQYLWPSGLYLSHLILAGSVDLRGNGKGKGRVLELGAGTGLPGLIALVSMALGLNQAVKTVGSEGQASKPEMTSTSSDTTTTEEITGSQEDLGTVVATDFGDTGICDVLRENYLRVQESLTSDSHSQPRSQIEARKKVDWEVLGFEWGTDPNPILSAPSGRSSQKYTTLLLSDTLFYTSSHLPLLQSICSLLEPLHGKAYLTAGFHGGSRGTVDRFIGLVRSQGHAIEELGVVKWNPKTDSWIDVEKKAEGEYGEGIVWSGVLTLSDSS